MGGVGAIRRIVTNLPAAPATIDVRRFEGNGILCGLHYAGRSGKYLQHWDAELPDPASGESLCD